MAIRTSTKTVTFRQPFSLRGLVEVLPAGAYYVEIDEERLEGISFPAYRRISAVIHLPAKSGRSGFPRALIIDPNELDAALQRDQASTERLDCREPTDRETVERRDCDGTIVDSESA